MGYIGIKKGEITMKNELLSEQWTNRRFPHQAAGTEDWGARAAVGQDGGSRFRSFVGSGNRGHGRRGRGAGGPLVHEAPAATAGQVSQPVTTTAETAREMAHRAP
jgi:hypothetical protein